MLARLFTATPSVIAVMAKAIGVAPRSIFASVTACDETHWLAPMIKDLITGGSTAQGGRRTVENALICRLSATGTIARGQVVTRQTITDIPWTIGNINGTKSRCQAMTVVTAFA